MQRNGTDTRLIPLHFLEIGFHIRNGRYWNLTITVVAVASAVVTAVIAITVVTVTFTVVAGRRRICSASDEGALLSSEDFQFDFFYELGKKFFVSHIIEI